MFDRDDHESHKSSSNLGQAQNTFLPPTWNAIETTNAQASRKRKLRNVEHENGIGEAFTIKSHPSLPFPPAQKLIPRLQIPRSCLPLAYLDPLGVRDDLPGSNLFSARINPLEDNVRLDRGPRHPVVLIAQTATNDGLFAIERVQEGIYAICRLAIWVTLDTFDRLQITPTNIARRQKRQFQEHPRLWENSWWSTAAIDLKPASEFNLSEYSNFEKTRAVRLCLQKPEQISTTIPAQVTQEPPPVDIQGQIGNSLDDTLQEAAKDPEKVLNMVRTQYQDALYASKSSLAYFAKGPLSRARAVFNVNDGSANDHSHLTSFLRSCILSLALMDLKYRETLPDLVRAFPFDSLSDEECTAVIGTVVKKARRSKKPSVGNNGLYPGEEANVARWWLNRELSSVACDTADAREEATKSAVLDQRARETQMQIVLSLETLALESAASSHATEKLPPVNIIGGDGSQNKNMKKKSKKPQDLSMLLDLLVDRLCIWQSMSVDEAKISNGEDRLASQHGSKTTVKAAGSSDLRHFCVDVVLPFYGARLPDMTTSLCKKLGAPVKPSPRRPPLAKSASSCTSLKPGASVQRQQVRKPRRTLERVLTDEQSASQKPPPSLSRSATAPVLPQVKHEVSDTSLSSIPLNRVALHKRYSQREVDLYATSQAAEAKLKKKARVEQELQDAIAALKRPNPRVAVKELVEDAERRATASHPRKPKNPIRNPFAQGAQVMATPSNNRRKDVYGGRPRQSRAPPLELEEVPHSSISCVPSSSRKAKQSPFLGPDSTGKADHNALPIDETPTRGPLKLWGRPAASTAVMESHADIYQPSPLSVASEIPKAVNYLSTAAQWPLHVHETPSKFRYSREGERPEVTTIHAMLVEAPSTADKPLETSTQPIPSSVSQEKDQSIYAALGWDDVDELL